MSVISFAFLHYFLIIVLLLTSSMLGNMFLSGLKFKSKLESIFFTIVTGLGIWSMILFALGVAGLLYKSSIYTISCLTIVSMLLKPEWRQAWTRMFWFDNKHLKDILIVILLSTMVYPVFLLFLYPPVAWDSISGHLPVARIYADTHHMVFTPYLRNPVFNQLTDLLFSGMLLIGDDIAAQSISLVSCIFIIIGLFSFSKHFLNAQTGFFSIAVWLSAPLILHLSSVAYIDMNLTLFTFAAVYAGLICISDEETDCKKKRLLVAGFLFGCAIGSKYSALIVLVLWLVVHALYRSKIIKVALSECLIMVITALSTALPWSIRNYYYSGNPVFPFFKGIFGQGTLWNSQDYLGQMQDLLVSHGLAKSLVNLIKAPYFLSFRPGDFLLEAPLTPMLFIGLILFLTSLRKNRTVWILFILSGAFMVSWFYSAQIPRYLLPVWPIFCILAGWGLYQWTDYFVKEERQWITITVICTLITWFFPYRYLTPELTVRGPIPVNNEQRDIYLTRSLPSYPAYVYLNKLPKGTLYALYDENMNYFYKGTFVGDWFGVGRYSDVVSKLRSGSELLASLRKFNTNYLLVNMERCKADLPTDDFFQKHFILIFEDKAVKVYSIQ